MAKRIRIAKPSRKGLSRHDKSAGAMISELAVSIQERNRYAARCALYDKEILRTAAIMERQQGLIEQLQAMVVRQHSDILRLHGELAEAQEVNANQAALITEACNQLTATAVELLEADKRVKEYEESLREARLLFDLGKRGRVVLYPPLRANTHAREAV